MTHQPLPWTRDRYGNYRDADGERVVLVGFARAGSGTPETDPCYGNTALVGQAVNAHSALVEACRAAEKCLGEPRPEKASPRAAALLKCRAALAREETAR